MIIDFEEKDHVYFVNGEIATVSVTELLKHQNIAPYGGTDTKYLKQAAERGKAVHKDLENVLNEPRFAPKTAQGRHFKEWIEANVDCGVGEQMLAYEDNGFILTGTADVMAIYKQDNGSVGYILADHKNTSSFHEEYVTWQVNLLDFMARKLGNEPVNDKVLNWKGADKFLCFHYEPNTGKMKVRELRRIDDNEIEKMIECEKNGKQYQRPVLVIDEKLQEKFLKAEERLVKVQLSFKKAEERAKMFREQLLKLFQEQNIKSWESPTGKMSVKYIDEVERLGVDSAKLKKEYPQVFMACQKLTKVKPQLRITINEEED